MLFYVNILKNGDLTADDRQCNKKFSFFSSKDNEIHSRFKECAFSIKWHQLTVKHKFSTKNFVT